MEKREKVLRQRLMGSGRLFRKVFREGQPEERPKEEKKLQGEHSR